MSEDQLHELIIFFLSLSLQSALVKHSMYLLEDVTHLD